MQSFPKNLIGSHKNYFADTFHQRVVNVTIHHSKNKVLNYKINTNRSFTHLKKIALKDINSYVKFFNGPLEVCDYLQKSPIKELGLSYYTRNRYIEFG